MTQPSLQVTGYRGIWGETLTAEIAVKYASAFAKFVKSENPNKVKPTILIGRDGRESGPTIAEALIPALEALGINVVYGDVLPTPTLLLAVKNHSYDGAIMITASHNPIEYNGVKFVVSESRLTNEAEVEKIKGFLDERESAPQEDATFSALNPLSGGSDTQKNLHLPATPDFPKEHADHILKYINVEAIRAKHFKVVVDMINASACVVDPYLFEQLGIELIPINNIPNGKFSHKPEPTIDSLKDTARIVKEKGADVGFAHDPDADRMVVINEEGVVLSEDYTLAFGVEQVLSKNKGRAVVVNMSTSEMIPDIAEKYDSVCVRTKVGESNVMSGLIEHNAIIGGEGTSGVIFPVLNNCRDSFISLSLVLELLAERNQKVTECVNSLPKYFMKRDKWPVSGELSNMYAKLKSHFANGKNNEIDGLRIDFDDKSWIHIRPSITEPIIRLFGEAKTQARVDELFAEAQKVIS